MFQRFIFIDAHKMIFEHHRCLVSSWGWTHDSIDHYFDGAKVNQLSFRNFDTQYIVLNIFPPQLFANAKNIGAGADNLIEIALVL